jgi:hypothetical protein
MAGEDEDALAVRTDGAESLNTDAVRHRVNEGCTPRFHIAFQLPELRHSGRAANPVAGVRDGGEGSSGTPKGPKANVPVGVRAPYRASARPGGPTSPPHGPHLTRPILP